MFFVSHSESTQFEDSNLLVEYRTVREFQQPRDVSPGYCAQQSPLTEDHLPQPGSVRYQGCLSGLQVIIIYINKAII